MPSQVLSYFIPILLHNLKIMIFTSEARVFVGSQKLKRNLRRWCCKQHENQQISDTICRVLLLRHTACHPHHYHRSSSTTTSPPPCVRARLLFDLPPGLTPEITAFVLLPWRTNVQETPWPAMRHAWTAC